MRLVSQERFWIASTPMKMTFEGEISLDKIAQVLAEVLKVDRDDDYEYIVLIDERKVNEDV